LERLSELEIRGNRLKLSAPLLDGSTIAFPKAMMKTVRLILVISVLCQFGFAQALETKPYFGTLYNASTISFGAPVAAEPLPADGLRLLVWNIHKGSDTRLPLDFSDLSFGADLALFQEAVSTPSFIAQITGANFNFGWTLAISFQQEDLSYTGVATASRVKALTEEVIISDAKEPLVETPKTILLSEFNIENTAETLLVANIHAINFVSLETFKTQIRQLITKIYMHQGPLVVAGDFNTWAPDRFTYLQKAFAPHGLKNIKTPIAGLLYLDHNFFRQMNAKFVFNLSHIESSDHAPLMVDLTFETNKVMKNETNP
jgi:endonuclease/exonuclease/phosphatase (EEP) superfamily protein YafD